MDFMNFLNGFAGLGGTAEGVIGTNTAKQNPWSVAAPQQGQQQYQWAPGTYTGGATVQNMPYDPSQDPEFMLAGTPPSLQAAMAQDQMQQNMVLPDKGSIPAPELGGVQSFPAGSGQLMPPAQNFQARPSAGVGFSDLLNFTGTASSDPSNDQGFQPNALLRMSEGYNRGGLLGALGMLLTNYK